MRTGQGQLSRTQESPNLTKGSSIHLPRKDLQSTEGHGGGGRAELGVGDQPPRPPRPGVTRVQTWAFLSSLPKDSLMTVTLQAGQGHQPWRPLDLSVSTRPLHHAGVRREGYVCG